VNEAMLCGRPVIVSDRVGARLDLVKQAESGYVFSCGDVDALARQLRDGLEDPAQLRRMGQAARARMKSWSPNQYIESLVLSISKTHESRAHR
jgi:glycosyltransferase involved in cell wall biosynthesis